MRIIPGLKDGASVSEALQLIAQTFRAAGIDDADVDARVLAGHALHLDRARLIVSRIAFWKLAKSTRYQDLPRAD